MIKMDSQYRLVIPSNVREVCNVDFEKEVRIYLYEKDDIKYLLLSNSLDLALPCFGKINCDRKYRFFLSKDLRKYVGVTPDSNFLAYTLRSHLLIKVL